MAKNVHAIIDELKSGLSELQAHFESLGSIFGGSEKTTPGGRKTPAVRRRRRSAAAVSGAKKIRKKPTLSPAVRAQRRLQGRYMAKFKALPKARQAQVRKVREEKGYVAALKMMP